MWPAIAESLRSLLDEYDLIVLEGAGSPAEINLSDCDLTNSRTAEAADAAVVMVCDIDRGGAFAHLYGIWALLGAEQRERIAGFVLNRFRLVLGNTWFWPADRRARMFSRAMSSRPAQRMILKRNLFVERILPSGISRKLSAEEMEHYRRVQPTPDSRVGVAELPRQIVAATPFLAELAEAVPRRLGGKRVLIAFPMRDRAFPAGDVLPRMRATFSDAEVVELPDAKHFFAEDAPDEIAEAIVKRFN